MTLRNLLFCVIDICFNSPRVVTLLVGAWGYWNGWVSLGQITTALLYVEALSGPLDRLVGEMDRLQVGVASTSRLLGIAEVPEDRVAGDDRPDGPHLVGEDLRFAYREGHDVLHGVSLDLEVGERLAIVGPSGSGKSTLLHIMGTLERPTDGVVRIGGVDAAQLDDRELSQLRARQIGFVFQQFFLAEHATVRENVADGLLYAGVAAAERYRRADEALQRVGLGHRATFKPTKISGGERQRVAIARALVGRPAIVLADEPTGNLDSTTGASIMELIHELNAAGATIILITHDGGLAELLPRQIRMLDGQVVSDTRRGKGELP
jgi:putative ABC transport system ATP-binding protein